MKIRNTTNGGCVEVTEDYGKALIAGGGWEAAEAPKRKAPRKTAQRAAKTPTPTPAEVPTTEE
ncbi:hypothetical protein PBI_STASIA_17 [Mycobacterium phage Stasia]|uniref:Uncharacterized protein n=1 Tax=Mycobacterium phage Stasia TaxID=1897548 RepID=A0A1D8EUF1_9CAUD|nr:head-tail connector protein [Mycobacterium phage Stasia]AOT24673.1 hypothetical protein PBI_STASIA_17 [Mycobacterium phage Stasia]